MPTRLNNLVKLILDQAQGNRTLAQQLLLKQVVADDALLRELVAPFLKSLTAAAIDRELRPTKILPTPVMPAPNAAPARLSDADRAALAARLGMESGYNPMRARTDAAQGMAPAPKPREASAQHVSALKLLADAYKAKKGERV